jgi:GTP-binding protein HflX
VEIQADHIPTLTVLNKIDRLADPEKARLALSDFPNSVAISALTGEGIPDLLDMVSEHLFETFNFVSVRLPYQEGALIALFHEQGQVDQVEHVQGGVNINGRLPGRLMGRYQPFIKKVG